MNYSNFKVNHLVTFTSKSEEQQSYDEAIVRLLEIEEVIGVWRQRVVLNLNKNELNVLDFKTSEIIEQFPIISVRKPEAINHNAVYNNLLIFTVYLTKDSAEMHIFDCRSNNGEIIVNQINSWREKCIESLPRMVSTYPKVNDQKKELKTYALIDKNKKDSEYFKTNPEFNKTKVKQTVNVFNQIAIERQKNKKVDKINGFETIESDNDFEIKPNKLKPFRYF